MDPMARLGAHLAAALQGGGTDADHLLLLHTLTDFIALLAAGATAVGILYLLERRRDFDFRPLLLITAAAFAVAATGDAVALWTLVWPDRWVNGWIQIAGGVMAFGAAILFWMQLPDVIRLPSGRQLRRANAALTRENWELRGKGQRLETEAQLLSDLLTRSTEATAIVLADGQWLHANEAFARLLGCSREELMKREPRTVLDPRLLAALEALEQESDGVIEGERRRLRWYSAPLRDGSGTLRARALHGHIIEASDHAHEAEVAEQRRRADEAVALLQHGLAEKEKSEAELARRAEQLERHAAQLERLGARVSELTGADPITGLGSSQALAGRLELALGLGKRYDQPFCVLLLAADPVDDLAPGDRLLVAALGEVVRAELRETDAAARCDEERICALLPHTGAAEAARVAERIRTRLAATPLALPDGRTLRLSCRIGAAQWRSGQGLGEVLGAAAENLRGRARNTRARG